MTKPLDRIAVIRLSSVRLPLATPVSDAKVLTGRQKPMTEIAFLFAEIAHRERPRGHRLQLLQARRRPRPVRARQGDRRRPDRRGPQRHRAGSGPSCVWAGASVGRSGAGHPGDRRHRHRAVGPQGQARRPAAGQAARRPPRLGALLQHLRRLPARRRSSEVMENATASLERRHRRHQDQGRPARHARTDLRRVARGARAPRRRRAAHGRRQPAVGPRHRACAWAARWRSSTWSGSRSRWTPTTPRATPPSPRALDTPIATGEMLTSVAEHAELIDAGAADIIQPDAPRDRRHHPVPASSPRWPSTAACSSPRTSRWRSTCTWPRPTRASRGWSTSTGWTRCSTSAWRSATAGCSSRTGPASASPSASRPPWTVERRELTG